MPAQAGAVEDVVEPFARPKQRISGGREWSVLVGATVRDYSSGSPQRVYYKVPVGLMDSGGARVLPAWGVVGRALSTGKDFETAYPSRVPGPAADVAEALAQSAPDGRNGCLPGLVPGLVPESYRTYRALAGWATGYLCGNADYDRYLAKGVRVPSLGHLYQKAWIVKAFADRQLPEHPADGQSARVLIYVDSLTTGGAADSNRYPLRLVASGGNWVVAAVEDGPQLTGEITRKGGAK